MTIARGVCEQRSETEGSPPKRIMKAPSAESNLAPDMTADLTRIGYDAPAGRSETIRFTM